jgi:hypothetical protein
MTPEDERQAAIERIKARRQLKRNAAVYAAVSVLLLAIWFFTNLNSEDGVFFWPVFPIAGLGAALLIEWLKIRGERGITDEDIRQELGR